MFAFLAAIRIFFRARLDISLEVLALRQQIVVLKRKRPRPSLNWLDRFFWTTPRQIWPRWSDVLVIVKPETVVGWHRAAFRLYWLAITAARRPTQGERGDSDSRPPHVG
jgi:putative transposase